MNQYEQPVEDFSEQYFVMPDVDVRGFSGSRVAVSDDLVRELGQYVSAPLVKLSTGHYWLKTEWGIPPDTIAVPHQQEETTNQPLLAKDHTVKALLNQGVIDYP